jgi:LuxR family transcriptional regulator, transcriptional regulator of spore coat protein
MRDTLNSAHHFCLIIPNAGFRQTAMTLTSRQQQILDLIAAEQTTVQIAAALGVSVATVETHRRNLFRKAGVRSMAGLVMEAMRQGLIH